MSTARLPRPIRSRRPGKRTIAFAATVLLAGGFTYLAVRGVHWSAAWRAVEQCDAWWLIPALGAFTAQTMMRAMRWRSLFAHARRPPRPPVIEATLIGYLFNNIMPARAGEAARVVSLTQNSTTPAAEIVGTVVVERAYDLFTVLLIFFCAVPWLPHVSWLSTAAVFAGLLAAAIAAAVAILAIYGARPLHWFARPLSRLPRLSEERIEREVELLAGGLSGLREHRVALEALIWSLAAWMMTALWAWFVLLAFQPSLPFAAGVLVMVATGASNVIPSPPAALGVFEGATVAALAVYHIHETAALPYAVVLHVSNFLPLVVAGAIALQFAGRRPARAAKAATYT